MNASLVGAKTVKAESDGRLSPEACGVWACVPGERGGRRERRVAAGDRVCQFVEEASVCAMGCGIAEMHYTAAAEQGGIPVEEDKGGAMQGVAATHIHTHLHCRHEGTDAGACRGLQGLIKGRGLLQPPGLRCRGAQHKDSHSHEIHGDQLHCECVCMKMGRAVFVWNCDGPVRFMR